MLTKDISYDCGGRTFTGYLADDDSRGPGRPGVLVCHQGNGVSGHTKERARMLAELGYVAFALDMYGEMVTSREQAMALLQGLLKDVPELERRARGGLDVLKAQVNVGTTSLAAIGFCFGGAVVLEMARTVDGLACAVAFHPGFSWLPDSDARKVRCKIMVAAGMNDPLVPASAREEFIRLMNEARADWQLLVYGNTGHSFTDKSVDALGMDGFAYHAATDARSWSAMRALFEEVLGSTR